MKKIFAVYYERDVNELGRLYPKVEDRQFNEVLFDIRDTLAKKNIDFVLITRQNPYVGNGEFFGYWQPADNFDFIATNLLLADEAVIRLLFSQKIFMTNAIGQLTASINEDGYGSYCIYYPSSGRKMFEFSSTKHIICYKDEDGSPESWSLGIDGDIQKNTTSDSWVHIFLYLLGEHGTSWDVEAISNSNFTNNMKQNYWRFISGTMGLFKKYNGRYCIGTSTSGPSSPVNTQIPDGYYTPDPTRRNELVGDDIGSTTMYVRTVYHIVDGYVTETLDMTSTS